jgi:hypothetical protein
MFEAHQWHRNGDHPDDNCQVIDLDADRITEGMTDQEILDHVAGVSRTRTTAGGRDGLTSAQDDRWCYLNAISGPSYQPFWSEGKIVRYYRNPFDDRLECEQCHKPMHLHGWINGKQSIGTARKNGTTVCPGSMIITRYDAALDRLAYEVMAYAEFFKRYRQVHVSGCLYVEYGTRLIDPEHPYRQALSYHRRLAKANVDRKAGDMWSWLARHAPRRLRTAVVIVETVKYSHDHPKVIVPEIRATELLEGVR